VLVGDSQPLFQAALVQELAARPELNLGAEAREARAAFAAMVRVKPDVAVLDMALPGLDAVELLRAVAHRALPTHVLFLTAQADGALAYLLLAEGAAGLLTKNAGADQIGDAVVAAADGQTVLGPEVVTALAAEIRRRARDEDPALSGREREVLGGLAEGRTAGQIGRELHVSESTVRTHMRRIYEKLGVSDRAQAVAVAIRRRLLE
jgi:two-component system nitrate/nitrite response regulator NarL